MTAHHFLVTRVDTGVLVGHALLCPAARYASVRWKGVERLDRRFASPPLWRAIDADLRIGWLRGRVDSGAMTYRLLVTEGQRGAVALQQTTEVPIDEHAHGAAAECDGYLQTQLWA
jgi:hypothetical protein